MEKKVPLAEVDVDAGMKSKYGDLVMDAIDSALRILLMNHVMERKYTDVGKKYKDTTEDVGKWKHKATGLQTRLNEALEANKAAEASAKELQTKLTNVVGEKEAVEQERDSLRDKNGELEADVKRCTDALAEYFEDGFERARAQALHFNLGADLSGLDSLKIIVDGKLVDEE